MHPGGYITMSKEEEDGLIFKLFELRHEAAELLLS
jgi:hypothetical protein